MNYNDIEEEEETPIKKRKAPLSATSKGNFITRTEFLHANKIPFTYTRAGASYELRSELWNCKTYNKSFTPKELNFIRSVKSTIKKSRVFVKFIKEDYVGKKIHYVSVNPKIKAGEVFEDVVCIDINSAYWNCAFNLGIIDEETFHKGQEVSKMCRLTSLGSLAKKKDRYSYDGETFKKEGTDHSYETENLWFAICYTVGEMMIDLSKKLGSDFITYWVDGIYFLNNPESIKIVKETFKNCGYGCKMEDVSKIEFFENEFKIHCFEKIKKFQWIIDKQTAKRTMKYHEYVDQQRLIKLAKKIMNEKTPKKPIK